MVVVSVCEGVDQGFELIEAVSPGAVAALDCVVELVASVNELVVFFEIEVTA